MQAATVRDVVLDLVLPPRCAGCGDIVGALGDFCGDCFAAIDWAGEEGCAGCAFPLEATEQGVCARCESEPGPIAATYVATYYGELPRSLVMRLKYGRRVALARTMARAMARRLPEYEVAPVLVPVPLHRWRLWKRGYNQALLLAREVGRIRGLETQVALHRTRATQPMKAMRAAERAKTVRGAFAADKELVAGRNIVLVDDVRTSGSTLDACARALLKAGAQRVEALVWARVTPGRGHDGEI